MAIAYHQLNRAQKLLWHASFWLVLYVFFAFIDSGYDHRYQRAFTGQAIQLPVKMLLCYTLVYYLIPRWLYRRKYVAFFGLLLLAIFAAATVYRLTQGYILLRAYRPQLPFTPFDAGRFLWAAFDVTVPAMIAAIAKLFKGHYESIQREQALQNEKLLAELRFLKAQVSPHFLFNTLNNIYGLSLASSPQTSEAILRLSGLLRFVLEHAGSPAIAIEEELEILDDYIALERLRYGERLDLKLEKEIDHPGNRIAPLLLLSLVENSFKHGASESVSRPFIHIRIQVEKGVLSFTIRNSKEVSSAIHKVGIGLQNIRRQLELSYGRAYSLDIRDESLFYNLSLNIRLHEYEPAELHDHRG